MANWGETFCGGTLPSEARMWVKLATRRLFNLYYQTLFPRCCHVPSDICQFQLPLWYNVNTPFMAGEIQVRILAGAFLSVQMCAQCVFTPTRRLHARCANKHTNLPPRVTPFLFDGPVGAHTDAQGRGHIAAVYTGETKTVVSLHPPSWFVDMVKNIPGESPIFIFELCDAILLERLSLKWPRSKKRTCVLCVDNQAAVAALVKGSSSSALGTLLSSLF